MNQAKPGATLVYSLDAVAHSPLSAALEFARQKFDTREFDTWTPGNLATGEPPRFTLKGSPETYEVTLGHDPMLLYFVWQLPTEEANGK